MNDPNATIQTVKYQVGTRSVTLNPCYAQSGTGHINQTLSCWKINGTDAGEVVDFYLFEDETSAGYFVSPTIFLDAIGFDYQLLDASGAVIPATSAMLQVTKPDTTATSAVVTSSQEQTVSATEGFSGDSPSGSTSYSATMGSSTSRTIPGVSVNNLSMGATGNDAHWMYVIQESSSSQAGNTSIVNQMLFRVPRRFAQAGVKLQVALTYFVSDHDGSDGTRYFNNYANDFDQQQKMVPGSPHITYTNDRIGYFKLGLFVTPVVTVPSTLTNLKGANNVKAKLPPYISHLTA